MELQKLHPHTATTILYIIQLLYYVKNIYKTQRRSRIDLNFATPTPFSFAHFGKSFQTEAAE